MEDRCTRHAGLPTETVRCAQGTCTQHVYHDPALRRTCTRPVAPHLTSPPCSLTTVKCSVAPKSAEPHNHAQPSQQASGCKARWVGHLGTQRSLNTRPPHPAGLECSLPPRVQLSAWLGQGTWRQQWRPTQGTEKIVPPLPLSSLSLIFLAGLMTEVQPAPGKRVRIFGAQAPSRVPLARAPQVPWAPSSSQPGGGRRPR